MESQRSFVLIALIFVSYLLYSQWQKDYGPEPVAPTQQTQDLNSTTPATGPASDIPEVGQSQAQATEADQALRYVTVKTDVLDLVIDTKGGVVVKGDLLQFPIEQHQPEPVHLLSQAHTANSGLLGLTDDNGKRISTFQYVASQNEYLLPQGADTLEVPLTWQNAQGISVTKTFVLKASEYDITVQYTVTNGSSSTQPVQQFGELKKLIKAPESSMMMTAYNAATYSTSDERYEKYDFDDMLDKDLLRSTPGGWVAMQQHYFVAAWVPQADQLNKIYSRVAADSSAVIGFRGPVLNVEPGQSQTFNATLYAGPKVQGKLEELSDTLRLTVDYGPLWFISQFLFWLLIKLQGLVTNWGVAIILITVIVKFALYPLTKKQTISMAKMRNLQPKLQALKEKFGDDRQKMGPAMMELYRKEKVNPMGGCLPLLLQMPIFLALYWMLMESVELRHSSFIFWITDLSTKDPYFVLPALYGASMFLMQKITPTPVTDPMQQKMMTWMPVVFSLLFVIFPSGLVLYWLVNNLISIGQTLYIYRQIDKKGLAEPAAKAAK